MIFLFCTFLAIGGSLGYDKSYIDGLWKQKTFFFSSFTDLHELGKNLTEAETRISFLNLLSSEFHEKMNAILYRIEENEENTDDCLELYENYVNHRNSTLNDANVCYEEAFKNSKFDSAKLHEAKADYDKFVHNLKIVIEKVEKKLKDNEASILGENETYADSRKSLLEASDYSLASYLNESSNYEEVYRNGRSILETFWTTIPSLNNCEEQMETVIKSPTIDEVEQCSKTENKC